jgi:hypothetical protein
MFLPHHTPLPGKFKILGEMKGEALAGTKYQHPFYERQSEIVIGGDYITTESGGLLCIGCEDFISISSIVSSLSFLFISYLIPCFLPFPYHLYSSFSSLSPLSPSFPLTFPLSLPPSTTDLSPFLITPLLSHIHTVQAPDSYTPHPATAKKIILPD